MTARKRAAAKTPKRSKATAPAAVESRDDSLGGPVEDSCKRCGLQTRIHPLDYHICDSCREAGWRSDPAGQKLKALTDAAGNDAGVQVVNAW